MHINGSLELPPDGWVAQHSTTLQRRAPFALTTFSLDPPVSFVVRFAGAQL